MHAPEGPVAPVLQSSPRQWPTSHSARVSRRDPATSQLPDLPTANVPGASDIRRGPKRRIRGVCVQPQLGIFTLWVQWSPTRRRSLQGLLCCHGPPSHHGHPQEENWNLERGIWMRRELGRRGRGGRHRGRSSRKKPRGKAREIPRRKRGRRARDGRRSITIICALRPF